VIKEEEIVTQLGLKPIGKRDTEKSAVAVEEVEKSAD